MSGTATTSRPTKEADALNGMDSIFQNIRALGSWSFQENKYGNTRAAHCLNGMDHTSKLTKEGAFSPSTDRSLKRSWHSWPQGSSNRAQNVLKTYRWPDSVTFPGEDVALVQIPRTERNATGRHRVREVLREILSNWAGHPVALEESGRGPIVQGFVRGKPIEVSLSYAGGDAWVAIRSNGGVGMDAVLVEENPDWEAVAELYLGHHAVQEIRYAKHRGGAFAERWAALEARYKLAKMPLREKSQPPSAPVLTLRVDDLIICIATNGQSPQ